MENEIRNEDIIAVKGCKFNLVQKDIKDEHYENKEESVERKEFRKVNILKTKKLKKKVINSRHYIVHLQVAFLFSAFDLHLLII